MAYATVDELKARLDKNLLRQLSDDDDLGITIKTTLESALTSGSDYADNIVPSFLSETSFLKEVTLLKAQEILFRRKGYYDAADSNRDAINDMLRRGNDKREEAAHTTLNSTPQAHTTTPVDEGKWDNWFEDDVW